MSSDILNTDMLLLEIEEEERKRKMISGKEQFARETKEREEWDATIQKGVNNFWEFCRLKEPKYYTEDKDYLKDFCEILQAFYEKRIIKFDYYQDWQIVKSTEYLNNYIVCKKLMINLPPRHGKSRTLINFSLWVYGKNQEERIIECSYNDDAAGDFAKYTRDGIAEQRIGETGFVFSDFFPGVKIKHGSNSYYKWALEGQYFSYLGAGIGGSITGKGGSILIIDDPIKLAEEAFNEDRLDKIWNWYTGTFLSRGDAEGGEPLELFNMTRWANGDPCGRILDSEEKYDWFVFKLEAYNEQTDSMLCEKVLSKKRYMDLRKKMVPEIFQANYHQETVDQKGRLYKTFKTYTDIPRDDRGWPVYEGIYNYTDTADEGNDYLCSVNYIAYNGAAYVTDVLYTKDGMEVTEPQTAKLLVGDQLWRFNEKGERLSVPNSNVNVARIESNNGGRGFARNVKRILFETYKTTRVIVHWFHQSKNKKARILSESANVQENIYFPVNWNDRWPLFYKAMTTYMKEGKNKNDDGPDTITGVSENIGNKLRVLE